jgi:co-chaperonin GroES (HSP10)
MAIPKNKKLVEIDQSEGRGSKIVPAFAPEIKEKPDTIIIKPVKCHNNYVAILQTQIETSIQLAGTDGQYKNEGLVIGVGPGISDGNGSRLEPSVKIGDYVMIGAKNHVATLIPDNGHYKGQKVVIVVENNIICELPTDIEYQIEA